MVLSMLSSFAGSYRILRNGALSDYNLDYSKNRISVSANETVCNWILKRSMVPTGIQIGSYQGFLIAEIDFFQLSQSRYLHRGCLFYESNE